MIVRLTADQLRRLADQIEAHTKIMEAGGTLDNLSGPLFVNGERIAWLHWWEDGQQFLAEFLDFEPGKPPAEK